MMEVARDHRASGNLINVSDDLFVGDANKIVFGEIRDLVAREPALLLTQYKRNAVHKSDKNDAANDMTGLHDWRLLAKLAAKH
jgi:hypothetical protein